MMKRYIILTIFFSILGASAISQNVLFSDDAENAYEISRKGRNRASFGHLYTGYRVAPAYFSSEENQVWNGEYFVGRRAKYALTRHYAMGWELEYLHTAVSWDMQVLMGSAEKSVSEKHRYISHALLASYYNRITFGKVGDNIGKFLDIGVYGAWNFSKKSVISGETDEGQSYETTKKSPGYDDDFFYGVKARLGIHRIAVTADYRLVTPDFTSAPSVDIYMPEFTVGLEFSLYKPKM